MCLFKAAVRRQQHVCIIERLEDPNKNWESHRSWLNLYQYYGISWKSIDNVEYSQ